LVNLSKLDNSLYKTIFEYLSLKNPAFMKGKQKNIFAKQGDYMYAKTKTYIFSKLKQKQGTWSKKQKVKNMLTQ